MAKVGELVDAAVAGGRDGAHRRHPAGPDRAATSSRPCSSTSPHDDADPQRGDLRPGRACRHLRDRGARPSAYANATEYGLVAYVYTGDLARGLRVSEAMESGMVGLNRGLVSDPAAPFGGVKQSGIGREGGHEGMLDYLESKYIAVQW